jgi:hypothetical protein
MDEMMTEDMGAPLKSITIEMQSDGTFMVGTEAEETEMPEDSAEDMAMDETSGMQKAATIDEALDLARQMLQDTGMSEEESVMAGYNKGAPKPKMTAQKVFGE